MFSVDFFNGKKEKEILKDTADKIVFPRFLQSVSERNMQ